MRMRYTVNTNEECPTSFKFSRVYYIVDYGLKRV